jgi:hypothetical protein
VKSGALSPTRAACLAESPTTRKKNKAVETPIDAPSDVTSFLLM